MRIAGCTRDNSLVYCLTVNLEYTQIKQLGHGTDPLCRTVNNIGDQSRVVRRQVERTKCVLNCQLMIP